jgi:hypothetical protein
MAELAADISLEINLLQKVAPMVAMVDVVDILS